MNGVVMCYEDAVIFGGDGQRLHYKHHLVYPFPLMFGKFHVAQYGGGYAFSSRPVQR